MKKISIFILINIYIYIFFSYKNWLEKVSIHLKLVYFWFKLNITNLKMHLTQNIILYISKFKKYFK